VVTAGAVALVGVVSVGRSAGAQGSVRGVTDKEITVGGLSSVTFFGNTVAKAAQARFDEANRRHQIPGGRKINFIGTADDKVTPDVALSEMRRLVELERVFAIVPSMSAVFNAPQYLTQQKVPMIGWGVSLGYCSPDNQYAFGFNGCLQQYGDYAADVAGHVETELYRRQGKNFKGATIALIGENYDASKSGVEIVSAAFDVKGWDVVYAEAPMPATPAVVTDFSPYVQALMTSNHGQPPDVIWSASGATNLFGLIRSLQQAGFKGQFLHSTYSPQPAATGAAAGSTATQTFATAEESSPAMDKIKKTLAAAGLDPVGLSELGGYYSADMFVRILQKVGENLTPERFQKVASRFTYEIPGVIGPTPYPTAFKVGTPCGSMLSSDGTKWSVIVPYKCFPTALKKASSGWKEIPYPQGVK
jgi:branched-chain amino acid transport system substrate-binding protein